MGYRGNQKSLFTFAGLSNRDAGQLGTVAPLADRRRPAVVPGCASVAVRLDRVRDRAELRVLVVRKDVYTDDSWVKGGIPESRVFIGSLVVGVDLQYEFF